MTSVFVSVLLLFNTFSQYFLINPVFAETQDEVNAETVQPTWTYEKVELNKEYVLPQNNNVKLIFTKLPEPSGNIKIAEVTLTEEQIKQTGSLSDKAYEITSDMKDGDFTYSLSLPIPEESKNKEVEIKFAENISEINSAEKVENTLTKTDSTVLVSNLDHMTIFVVVYDAVPSVSSTNYPSLGFQATQTNEFGDYIHLGGSDRLLNSVTVTMSDWAKYSDYASDGRYSGNNASWTHPITINIYGAELNLDGTPKTKLGSVTQDISIPWRPEGDPTCPDDGYGLKWKSESGVCYNGMAFNAVVDMSSLNLVLPDDIIVGIAYNTNTWGYSPIGSNGPYESLNVAVPANQPIATGSDDNVNEVFWNTVTKAWYADGGAGGYGVFRKDSNWTPNGTVAFKIEAIDTTPACDASSFDSFSLGSVNGQDGWTVTGPFDQAIVKNSYGYTNFGCKSLRISDAVTSGSFGDQIFASPQPNGAGETTATAGSFSIGTRQNHFEAQLDIASAVPGAQQPGMHISVSPDRGDGSRMSYLRFEDNTSGIDVFFYDVQGTSNPANFVETKIASGLDRSVSHTIKIAMDFVEGPSNDIVKVWIDGTQAHAGTSWENYYRYDSEASAEQSIRIVKTVLFRQSGTATPANSGKGFLIDNFSTSSSTVAPSAPTHLSPADNSILTTAALNKIDWTDVSGPFDPVKYNYQSSKSTGTNPDGSFTNPAYTSGTLTNSEIATTGTPQGTYYWHVRSVDANGNKSAWSSPWKVTVDNTAPSVPTGIYYRDTDHGLDVACSGKTNTKHMDVYWNANPEPDFDHYEYISYNANGTTGPIRTFTTNYFNASWWTIPTEGTYGVQIRAVDKAGNISGWYGGAQGVNQSCKYIADWSLPTVDLVFPSPGPSSKSFQAIFSEPVIESEAENPANYLLNNWPGAGGSGDLAGDATVTYDPATKTATVNFTAAGWYISPEQQWGVQNIHDLAGNLQSPNPYTEYSTAMVDPVTTDSGTDSLWHKNSVTVNFSCSDAGGSGCKSTHYTTDGSNPTTSSPSGSSVTLSADGIYTIKYFSTDRAGNAEDVKTAANSVKIDKTTPAKPVITTPTAEQRFKTSPILNRWGAITDASGIKQYTVEYVYDDGHSFSGAPYRYTTTNSRNHSPSISEQGGVTIRVRAEDNAGNLSEWSEPVHYIYDATAPTVASVSSDGELYNLASADPNIKITFNEDMSTAPAVVIHSVSSTQTVNDCSDADAKTYCFTYNLTNEEATHTIEISGGKDLAGNTMATNSSHTFEADRIAPTLSSKTMFEGWYNTDQTSTFTYADVKGIASGNNPTCDITTEGSNQTCSVTPNVCDNAGNCDTTPVTSNGADMDFTDPESVITTPSNSGSGSTKYMSSWSGAIEGTASDFLSGVDSVKVSIQNSSEQYFDGSNFVDSATEILLDTTYLSGDWQYSGLTSPEEGSYTIKSHAIDTATNMESTYSLTVILDKTIPEVSISIKPDPADASNGWYKTQPEITLTSTDSNKDVVEYQWNSKTGNWTTYSSPFKPGSEGAHVLYYRARDKANNYSDTGVKNVSWDQTELTDGPLNVNVSPNPTSGTTAVVKWDEAKDNTGIDRYEVKWNLKNGDKSYTDSIGSDKREHTINNLVEGVWTVQVTAFDRSGKSKSSSVDLTVDRTNPQAPTLSIFETSVGSVSLNWTKVDDAVDYIIWYGTSSGAYQYGAKVGNTTSYTVQGLGAGSYYFIVKAVDQSGNQSGNSNEVSTGQIAGAENVAENTPAEGFSESVLGESTKSAELEPTGSVLGESQSQKQNNKKQWYWLLILLLIPAAWFIYKKRRANED